MTISQLVRKEFRPRSTSKTEYELEIRNLSFLKLLKHPHIVELLGCYTYRDRHNLLFPLARGGTLADLLSADKALAFSKDEALIVALCGLSSALCVVHNFVSDDLKAIGCHHDLKPSNILVDDTKFLLADFGLSRFKEIPQASATLFRGGRGDYIAPECEDLENGFEKHVIHRSSDIWSFGCILSEVLTYMIDGPAGVRDFKQRRKYKIESTNWNTFRFHCGSDKPNNNVLKWLEEIEQKTSTSGRLITHLVRQMLFLKPEVRPKILEIDATLRLIAVDNLAQPIECLYRAVCQKSGSVLALVEQERFKSWGWALRLAQNSAQEGRTKCLGELLYDEFRALVARLQELTNTLEDVVPVCQNPRGRVFLPLRRLNDSLLGMLPRTVQESARTYLECHMLQSDDTVVLDRISRSLHGQSSSDDEISLFAAIKRMHLFVTEIRAVDNTELQIDLTQLREKRPFGDFCRCRIAQDGSQHTQNALVEWRAYGEHYSDKDVAKELFSRLQAITKLLNSASQRESLRVLHCRGFYHDPACYNLGLVYEFPQTSYPRDREITAITLRQILENDSRGKNRPLLGDRFRLALNLATSILDFHKISWLQKAISSFNIVFFYPEGHFHGRFMEKPYLLGFLSSRQNDESAFTEGPTEDSRHKDYQHPKYLGGNMRFRPEYDYYSLGIVLLELGLWSSLSDMTKGGDFLGSPEQFRRSLLQKRVPLLGQTMGYMYQQAVTVCLEGDFGMFSEAERKNSVDICFNFKELVVDRLASCRA
jgi:hypothetical protein